MSVDYEDGWDISYSVSDTTHYAIDTNSGVVTLTEAGAALVNRGDTLPAFNVTATSSDLLTDLAYTVTASEGMEYLSTDYSLNNINDDDISTTGYKNYQVHPINADGEFIEFSFEQAHNLETFTFYNRADALEANRIVGSTLEFFSGDTLLGTETITQNSNIIEKDITEYDNVDRVKLVFSGDNQNFREVDFSGVPTSLSEDATSAGDAVVSVASASYEAILDKFISVARDALPQGLSSIGNNGDLPAVVRARQKGPKPDYPYVTLDVLDTKDEHGWQTVEYLNGDNHLVTEVNKVLLLNYRVYGGLAIDLANKLYTHFSLARVRDDIRTTLGGSVVTLSNIDQTPVLLSTEYVESATFNINFNITDVLVDTNTGVFDTVGLQGYLHSHEQDTTSLDISITLPTS